MVDKNLFIIERIKELCETLKEDITLNARLEELLYVYKNLSDIDKQSRIESYRIFSQQKRKE